MEKNIVEKYIEIHGKFIILISGLPGCGKQELGENIARDFKFELLNTYSYYKENYDNKIQLKNPETDEEIEIINWYTDDAVDWDKLNNDINKYKKNGVVIIGMSLSNKIVNDITDYHIHLNVSKQVSIENTQKYIEEHKNKYPEEYKIIGTPIEKLKMNKLIYPYYLETTKLAKINKYITVKEMNDDEIYDIAFDVLIQFVQKFLGGKTNNGQKQEKKAEQNIEMELELLNAPRYTYDDDMDLIRKIEKSDDTSTDEDTEVTTSDNTTSDSTSTDSDSE